MTKGSLTLTLSKHWQHKTWGKGFPFNSFAKTRQPVSSFSSSHKQELECAASKAAAHPCSRPPSTRNTFKGLH